MCSACNSTHVPIKRNQPPFASSQTKCDLHLSKSPKAKNNLMHKSSPARCLPYVRPSTSFTKGCMSSWWAYKYYHFQNEAGDYVHLLTPCWILDSENGVPLCSAVRPRLPACPMCSRKDPRVREVWLLHFGPSLHNMTPWRQTAGGSQMILWSCISYLTFRASLMRKMTGPYHASLCLEPIVPYFPSRFFMN